MEYELLKGPEVAAYCRISYQHMYRLIKAGQFPKPIRLGHNVRWHKPDIIAYLKNPGQSTSTQEPSV